LGERKQGCLAPNPHKGGKGNGHDQSLNNIDKRLRRIEKRLRSPVALLVPLTIYLLLKRRKLKKLRKEHEKALREEAGALRLVLTV